MKNDELLRILMEGQQDVKDALAAIETRMAIIEATVASNANKWKEFAKIAGPIMACK